MTTCDYTLSALSLPPIFATTNKSAFQIVDKVVLSCMSNVHVPVT